MKATVAPLDSLKIFRMPRKVFEDLAMKLDQLLLCQMLQPSGQSSARTALKSAFLLNMITAAFVSLQLR
jgi:hypothetical protein